MYLFHSVTGDMLKPDDLKARVAIQAAVEKEAADFLAHPK
jgi:hypothetical protein